jgi:hypothetical protein
MAMEAITEENKQSPAKAKAAKKPKKKKLPTLTCRNCGEKFTTTSPSRSKSKMCPMRCATIFHNKNRVWSKDSRKRASIARKMSQAGIKPGSDNVNWNGGGVGFSCHCCLKSFTVPYNEVKAGKRKGVYCSAECYRISHVAQSKASEKLARCTPVYAAAMMEIKRLEGIIKQVHDISGVIIGNLNDKIQVPQPISQIFSLSDLNEPS